MNARYPFYPFYPHAKSLFTLAFLLWYKPLTPFYPSYPYMYKWILNIFPFIYIYIPQFYHNKYHNYDGTALYMALFRNWKTLYFNGFPRRFDILLYSVLCVKANSSPAFGTSSRVVLYDSSVFFISWFLARCHSAVAALWMQSRIFGSAECRTGRRNLCTEVGCYCGFITLLGFPPST